MRYHSILCVVSFLAMARAQGAGMDSFFAPGNKASYSTRIEPGHEGSPRVLHQRAEGSLVLTKRERDTWTLSGHGAHMDLSQPVALPQGVAPFPDSLGDVEGGLSFLRQQGDRRQMGAGFSVGSASDKLFHSIHETEFRVTGSAMIPHRAQNAWLFLLSYSNNRNFLNNIPLPGIEYLWNNREKGLYAVIGFPFNSLRYQPNENWNAHATVLGFTNVTVEAERRVRGPFRVFAAYERAPEQWLRAGRSDHEKRLIYDEKKVLLGLRGPVIRPLSFELSGGRTFDRRMFEAKDASHTDDPRVALQNGWIVSLSLSMRWGRSGPRD